MWGMTTIIVGLTAHDAVAHDVTTRNIKDSAVRFVTDGLESSPNEYTRAGGLTIWMTGLSGSGKTTIAAEVVKRLDKTGKKAYRLDGDNLRKGLNSDLGFSAADRNENNRRIAETAKIMNHAGIISICALIAPFAQDRDVVRNIHERENLHYMEVFIDAPLEVTEKRDPKGMYVLARSGKIKEFTGLTSPYEKPANPDVHIQTHEQSLEESVEMLMTAIEKHLRKDSEL